ncbi:MAG: hypothetical protein KGI91_04570 [Burkholderiales bacterium]|nr:hypothetical protein [Burkholderiales bacterium]MDE2433266.1 hypothetical protein [Burkholderiales bacterium]
MSRLLIASIAGLLWAGTSLCHAHQLKADDPTRIALVAQARTATVKGHLAPSALTMNRVWVEGAQAQACGIRADEYGAPLIVNGQMQLKRVQFRKRGGNWQVEHADRISLDPTASIDAACGQKSEESVMMAAIKDLEAHPPAAGLPTRSIHKPSESCEASEPKNTSSSETGPGFVGAKGRSLLHSAPDLSCYIGKFIVGGDKVSILSRVPGWARVSYTHPITHVTTVGWMKSDRVKLAEAATQ